MKKKLESELVSIAHRILKLKGKEDVTKMHTEVAALYERLSVLKFAHQTFDGNIPTIGNDSSFFDMLDVAFNNKVSDNIELDDGIYVKLDDVEDDGIMEPAIEKIKDMVAQMPHESQVVDNIIEESTSRIPQHKTSIEDLTADFKETPVFEPVLESNTKKSLNDKLKKGVVTIGLNDKIAFIKHLFNGSNEDYDRVLSQLNTFNTLEEVNNFILTIIKPDNSNWEGKEDYEERFMEIIESKFN